MLNKNTDGFLSLSIMLSMKWSYTAECIVESSDGSTVICEEGHCTGQVTAETEADAHAKAMSEATAIFKSKARGNFVASVEVKITGHF
jgi:hypothetical protein